MKKFACFAFAAALIFCLGVSALAAGSDREAAQQLCEKAADSAVLERESGKLSFRLPAPPDGMRWSVMVQKDGIDVTEEWFPEVENWRARRYEAVCGTNADTIQLEFRLLSERGFLRAQQEVPLLLENGFFVREDAQALCEELVDSVAFAPSAGTVSLTIPQTLPDGCRWFVHLSGRAKMGEDAGMSVHWMEDLTYSYGWQPGETYTAPFDFENTLDFTLYAALMDEQGHALCETPFVMETGRRESLTLRQLSLPMEKLNWCSIF